MFKENNQNYLEIKTKNHIETPNIFNSCLMRIYLALR